MPLAVLTRREASIFTALADAAVAPAVDMPPVAATSAIAALDDFLAHSAPLQRAGLRGMAYALELAPLALGRRHRFRGLPRVERTALLRRIERTQAGRLLTALRAVTVLSYYGDDQLLRARGYDPDANLARARAVREAAGRW